MGRITRQAINNRKYNGIDLFKFIAAFVVVNIHLAPLSVFGESGNFISLVLSRVAVPFFFCASGFFLRLKLDSAEGRQEYKKVSFDFIKRVLLLYLVWTCIYFPCIIFWIKKENKTIIRFLQECIFDGSYLHLWYLPSLAIAGAIICFLYRRVTLKNIFCISIVLYVIGMVDSCWKNLFKGGIIKYLIDGYDSIFITSRNGLLFGLLFVTLGFCVKDVMVKNKIAVVGMIISVIMLFAELGVYKFYNIGEGYDSSIFVVPLTFCLFKIAQNLNLKGRVIWPTLRKMGVLIYFGHCWVDFTFAILCYNVLHKSFNSIVRFGYTILIVVPLSFFIVRLQEHKHFRWLKILY